MAFISSEGVTCPDHGTTKLSLSAGICLWGYSFLKLQLFLKAILCLWTWQGSIMWWLGERIRIAMWVSKCPFDLVTRKEPFEKIIQSRINFRNWNCQQEKKKIFKMLEATRWLLTTQHLAAATGWQEIWIPTVWAEGTLQPFCLEARCLSPVWACWFSAWRPFPLKPECPFTSSKHQVQLCHFSFFMHRAAQR